MPPALKPRALELLQLVADYTEYQENDFQKTLQKHFVPTEEWMWSKTRDGYIRVGAGGKMGDSVIFKGMEARGLIRAAGGHLYAYALTKEGFDELARTASKETRP